MGSLLTDWGSNNVFRAIVLVI